MASEYCRQILRVVVAQLCQHLGWHSTHATPLEVLTDVLERYILDVSRTTHQYAERYGRTEVNLDDLGLAFRTLDISLPELEDYVKHVEALPFGKDLAAFPKPKKSNFGFPNQKSREIYHREEHVSDYLPYMFPGMEDEMEVEEEVSPTPSVPAASQPGSTTPVAVPANQEIGTPENLADTSPALKGEKRALSSPSDGTPNYKRQRISNNNLPEEAGHSQYEMTSIKMSVTGLLTPIKSQGKLPDSTPPVMFVPIEKKKEPPPPKEIVKKTEPAKDISTSKIEDKENITTKKPKENDPCKKNIPVKGSSKIVSKTSASSSSSKPLKKNLIGKTKVTKVVKKGNMKTAAVSVKSAKSKMISKTTSKIPAVKPQPIKGATKPPILKDIKSLDASGSESRLKELLLDPKIEKATKVERKLEKPSPLLKKPVETVHKPWSNLAMPKNHPEMLPKNVHLVPDDSSSSDESPEPRLVIAESDPKPKDKKSADMASKYDSIISSAIRRAGMKSQELAHLSLAASKEKKKPVVRKTKKEPPMEKIEKSTLGTIDECINSVMRKMRETYELEKQKEFQEALVRERIAADAMLAAAATAVAASSSSSSNNMVLDMVNALSPFSAINPSPSRIPALQKTDWKEDKKLDKKLEKKRRNLMKEKTKKLKIKALKQKGKENAEVRQKLKEKLKSKPQYPNSSGSEKTPAIRPDNFTPDEWKIYDFDGSPRGSYTNSPHELDSSPLSSSSPHSIGSCVSPSMDSLTLLSTAAAAAASNVPMQFPLSMPISRPPASVSSQDSDIPSQLKMTIGLTKEGKNKTKSKVKSKDKEHKKDKKDKKKDKEKKKKNKEKEEKKQKERAKEENYQCVVVPQADQISTPLSVPRLKLNIKFGGSLPVAVPPDTELSKKTPAPMPAVDRTQLNTPTSIKQDIPTSPISHRPEIPRLVIRTPVPVKSPPTVPMKVEKPTAKVTKPTPSPKAKATPKKTPIVKKPVVKKEKPIKVPKSAKFVPPEPINVPSICRIEALNAPPQIPQFVSNVSPIKHSEIRNDNIVDKLTPESFIGVKTEKFSPTKPFTKSQKITVTREKLTPKEKQMLLKGQILQVSPEFPLRQAEENLGLKASKMMQSKMKTPKVAKPAAKLIGKKLEKVFPKGKSEKATARAKAEKCKAEKVALEMAATALAKVEKPLLIKDKPIIKMNRPPNKLGRPPKNPPLSPPPTIPYPSSPPCIPASIGGMLPVAQPIGHHHFTPNLANIPTPVPKIPRPSPVTPKSVPTVVKVAAVAKTVSAPRGRGARSGTMTKAQKMASAKLLMPPAKESDLYVTSPANLLTPMPLTSPPTLPEKLMSLPNKPSSISSPLSSSLHMIGGLPPDNSLIALPRDIASANMPMDSPSFNIPIDGMTGSGENPMSLGKRPVQRSVFAETVGTFMDENGQKIWICPGCKLPDDGSPMIGCDGCDDWYHWPCVNIREEPPSEEQWFCQKCLLKTKNKPKRKRRRKTKTY